MNKIVNLLVHPNLWVYKVVSHYPALIKDDRKFIEFVWKYRMPYPLNLDNPKTFNEKIQWLKLYDRRPEYTMMVDKFSVKDYVAGIIGEEHIIPTLGVWSFPEEIDWDALPKQFVLKCTHDSGGLVICKDKDKLDKKAAIRKLNLCLKNDYYLLGREWPYKNVSKKVIAEKYISDEYGELRDYKFFCFNGEPKLMFLLKDRGTNPRLNFYDLNFNKLPFERGYPNFIDDLGKPKGWEEMIKFAGILSKGIPSVRVDFYNVEGNIFFGEITFSPGSGFEAFTPHEWDIKLGEWIDLPDVKKSKPLGSNYSDI